MGKEQYIEVFIEETREHLQNLTQMLLQLEKNPEDKETINEIFRSAHTLKGMSGTMGFESMSGLTHKMEDVLDLIRTDKIMVEPYIVDLLFKCLDSLEEHLESIISTGNESDNKYIKIIELLEKLISESGGSSAAKGHAPGNARIKNGETGFEFLKADEYEYGVIMKAREMGMNVFQINVTLDKGCLLKSARTFIVFQALEKHSEIIKAEPPVEDLEDEKFDFEFSVIVVTSKPKEVFIDALYSISEIEKVEVELYTPRYSPQQKQDSYQSLAHDADTKASADDTAKNRLITSKTVRVDIERLDVLMNLVSELIILKTRLGGIPSLQTSGEFVESIEYLERVATNLHNAVMKVRMVTLEKVFSSFPRMIRDIARELNKKINLVMSGEKTELDRTVIDEIGEPLIHILRNAAYHGLEPAEVRKKMNKPEEGNIYLRAYQVGNSVVIEIEDDGQGLDMDAIRKTAIEKGLIKEEYAFSLSREEVMELIFTPGFSTAKEVSDLSGRGVGLDVVKTKIESMSGSIEMETEKGRGTKFTIRLPLTLAIIQALLVQVVNEKYAIPLNSTSQIVKIKPSEIRNIQKREVILLRDQVIPVIRLDSVLEVPEENTSEKKELTVVTVKKGEKLSGFIVDKVLGQQEIVIKSLGKLCSGIKCIAGATILGDGNVALILDINSLA
ncbi:MAG TPA: chemotaxis protein CheA [Clostridiaceae bacterium]|nr:chemotaxis protein CheA [Clostridiaceae bacterium]